MSKARDDEDLFYNYNGACGYGELTCLVIHQPSIFPVLDMRRGENIKLLY